MGVLRFTGKINGSTGALAGTVVSLLSLLWFAAGCGDGTVKDTPEAAVRAYFTATMTGDDGTAKALLGEAQRETYEPPSDSEKLNFSEVRVKKTLTCPDGMKAKVSVRLLYKDGKESELTFSLHKVRDSWQIFDWNDDPLGAKWEE